MTRSRNSNPHGASINFGNKHPRQSKMPSPIFLNPHFAGNGITGNPNFARLCVVHESHVKNKYWDNDPQGYPGFLKPGTIWVNQIPHIMAKEFIQSYPCYFTQHT